MGRKRAYRWRWRVAAACVLLLAGGLGWLWWQAQHWTPPRAQFPLQGVLVSEADGALDFRALKAIGADFVYVEASTGADGRDGALGRNIADLRAADMPFGPLHHYDPCVPAEDQVANFVTLIERDAAMLPPVIALDKLASECGNPAIETGLEAELTTFLNQMEGHTGQAAVLRISPAFEEHYRVASRIERNLWLDGGWIEPDYAGRPFTLWTANPQLWTEVTENPVRWVVAQP